MASKVFKELVAVNNSASPYNGQFVWSEAGNWLADQAIPVDGDDVSYTTGLSSGTDSQYDDIAGLSLNSLTLGATSLAGETLDVTANLTVGTLNLASSGPQQSSLQVATNALSSAPVSVTINGQITGGGTLGVETDGQDEATLIDDAIDQGHLAFNNSNGIVYLKNAPLASSSFTWSGAGGVYEFASPGSSIDSALKGVQSGVSVELPAWRVMSVTYGTNSVSIAVDLSLYLPPTTTYNFSNVTYAGPTLNAFTTEIDNATGLEKITFLSALVMQANVAATDSPGFYEWSNAANWSTGSVPSAGSDVVINSAGLRFLDDLANVTVNRLMLSSNASLYVGGAMTIDSLQLDDFALLAAGGGKKINIDKVNPGYGDTFSTLVAIGVGSSIAINGMDGGAGYEALQGGTIVFNTAPNDTNTVIVVETGSTLVLAAPGVSVGGVTTINAPISLAVGAAIELPGAKLLSTTVNRALHSETITTDAGSYIFADPLYEKLQKSGNTYNITDFIVTHDPTTGLLKLTGEGSGAADNPQHNSDVNGDGFADMIWRDAAGQTAVWTMNGANIVSASYTPETGAAWSLAASGDFTGDGKSDLLFQNIDGSIAEWLMNGATIASASLLPDPGSAWTVDATGDFNGDGMSDIALQNVDGSVAIWEMNGANILADGAAVVAQPGTAWKPIASGDFWGDGKSELVFQNTNGTLAVWGFKDSADGPTLDMTHTAALSSSLNLGSQWIVKGTGDFNGDGKSDLVFQNSASGAVTIWEMNQTGLLASGSSNSFAAPNGDPAWVLSQVGDFNGDGKSDLMFQNSTTGQVDIWTMNGLNLGSSPILDANPGTSWHALG